MSSYRLVFEKPIYELEERLAQRESAGAATHEAQEEIRHLRRELARVKREIYDHLDAWQTVQVARHPERPQTSDYLTLLFEEFVELHGDRTFGDDRALRTGFANLSGQKVMFIGHQKGRTIKERQACYFGCAHPEGYRKALGKMKLAAKFKLPIISFIDTPGAYPGIGAEERGQAQMIAINLMEMARLPTPIVCVVIGEGGSGGALGIGVGDRVSILQHAYYSVISPEGCAGILWKSGEFAPQAAEALKLTSKDLLRFGVVDDVIPEPLGGAHRDHRQMANTLATYLARYLKEIKDVPIDQLLDQRYEKFRRMGVFEEAEATTA